VSERKLGGEFTVFHLIFIITVFVFGIGALSVFHYGVPALLEETTQKTVATIEEGSRKEISQKEIMEKEKPKAFLGVVYRQLGMEIIGVYPGSVAEKIGLKKSDIIKSISYTNNENPPPLFIVEYDLKSVVSKLQPGYFFSLVIERGGKITSLGGHLGVMPPKENQEKFLQQTKIKEKE